jgi:hypothetical protein
LEELEAAHAVRVELIRHDPTPGQPLGRRQAHGDAAPERGAPGPTHDPDAARIIDRHVLAVDAVAQADRIRPRQRPRPGQRPRDRAARVAGAIVAGLPRLGHREVARRGRRGLDRERGEGDEDEATRSAGDRDAPRR